jgi:Lrp/AsnC family leucine-responsive transcriptional regulator
MAYSQDDTYLKIIVIMNSDTGNSNNYLARRIGMAPSAMLERVKKLEQNGVILGYPTRIKPESLQLKLLAFIFIKSSDGPGNAGVAKQLAKIPEVLELHHIAGEDCYLLKVRVRDPLALVHLMREKFSKIPHIVSTKSTIVLETIKEDNRLPIPKSLEDE